METDKKILIIQTAFLGDVILALPIASNLKKFLPGCGIDFLCIPGTANVLENNPCINSVIKYDKKGGDKIDKFIEALSVIREVEYDIVISPHRSFRSALLTYYSEAKTRIGFDRNSLSGLLTRKVKYRYNAHEIHRNLDLVKAVPGINFNEAEAVLKPELFPSDKDKEYVDQLLNSINSINSKNSINYTTILAPCSKWFTKQLTLKKSIDISESLLKEGHRVVLIGGEGDVDYCMELEGNIKNDLFINLCGKLTPLQSYTAIKRSSVLVTVDSAVQHLGAASGTPVVLIYGSTDRSFGFYPLTSEHRIIEMNGLECRPCTDHGRSECPLKHFKCVEELNTDDVVNAVRQIADSR